MPVWPDGQIVFSIFGHLQQWNFAQKHPKSPKQGFTTFPNIKSTFKMIPKISKCLQNWRNFAKSVHTANCSLYREFYEPQMRRRIWFSCYVNFSGKKVIICASYSLKFYWQFKHPLVTERRLIFGALFQSGTLMNWTDMIVDKEVPIQVPMPVQFSNFNCILFNEINLGADTPLRKTCSM